MATFLGTSGADLILRQSLSSGVTTDPIGVTGTLSGEWNLIRAGGGNDVVELGDWDSDVYAGRGNDTVVGGAGDDWINGEDGRDVITGGAGRDQLSGGRGTDVLGGGADWDRLDGGTGADLMLGGAGWDDYVVDSYGDLVIERAGEGLDRVFTDLRFYVAPRNVEGILYEGPDGGEVCFLGNGGDNIMQIFANVDARLAGFGGSDGLSGGVGDDTILGGGGDDLLNGGDLGTDLIRGGDGSDVIYASVYEADGRDTLIGGRGADVFIYQAAVESTRVARDVIRAGDGASAFEGAGRAGGDVLDLSNMDADETDSDFTHLTFGGTGKGTVSCVDFNLDTLVRANVDDDAEFEFQLLIEDGRAVSAANYTAEDFLLTYV